MRAVSYRVGGGGTEVDLVPTGAIARASGVAKVEAKKGITNIEVEVRGMTQPTSIGAEFLTFVLWTVSPEGRTTNVGEIQLNQNGEGKLKATSAIQTFSLFVTAEPYFAVRQPSEVLVLENELRKNTKGKIIMVSDYKLMRRAQYQKLGNPLALSLDLKKTPLELYQARNAVDIAKSRQADRYAQEIFSKAAGGLQIAEAAQARKANVREVISTARLAVQSAEDARALAVQRQEEERIANERAAAAAQAKAEAEAKAAHEAEIAKQKADAEAARLKQEAARLKQEADAEQARLKREADAEAARLKREADAEQARLKREAEAEAKRQAEIAAAKEAQMKAEADAAALKAKMEADALKAKEEAAKAEAERARQAAEALRAQLLSQLNRILETADTPRGLVITMADVLFDTGKYDLRPPTREKLAQLSGIILAHPGLSLDIEGHTDSTGSDELNQKLSEQRAGTVRDYLVQQGLSTNNLTAKGFGKTMPIADNTTAAGRQKNRRVELILSGEAIGVKVGR